MVIDPAILLAIRGESEMISQSFQSIYWLLPESLPTPHPNTNGPARPSGTVRLKSRCSPCIGLAQFLCRPWLSSLPPVAQFSVARPQETAGWPQLGPLRPTGERLHHQPANAPNRPAVPKEATVAAYTSRAFHSWRQAIAPWMAGTASSW